MRSKLGRAAALSLAVLLAACAGKEPAPDHFYRLDVPPAAARLDKPLFNGVVEVAPLLAEGLVSDRAVVYLYADQPYEMYQYSYNFWNTPPSAAIQEQLVRYLRSANLSPRVVTTDLRLPVEVAVEGRIRRFEQIFDGGVRMVVELEIAVIRAKEEKLVLLKVYRAEKPAADDSLPAAAVAASQALGEIFSDLVADLKAARPTS